MACLMAASQLPSSAIAAENLQTETTVMAAAVSNEEDAADVQTEAPSETVSIETAFQTETSTEPQTDEAPALPAPSEGTEKTQPETQEEQSSEAESGQSREPTAEIAIQTTPQTEDSLIFVENGEDPESQEESREGTTEDTGEKEPSDPQEHFTEAAEGIDALPDGDFVSGRLVVLAAAESDIVDAEHIAAQYENLFLLQYGSVEQTKTAYLYYMNNAAAVEPDTDIEAAADAVISEDGTAEYTSAAETAEVTETAESTPAAKDTEAAESTPTAKDTEAAVPFQFLAGEPASVTAVQAEHVIALIDTGVSENANVIDRISVIDSQPGGGGHGDRMAQYISEQDPDAKILSIRAIGDDGKGTVSSVVAAIEYALNSGADIINLSLYAKANLASSVLTSEIQKAVDSGVVVVGAAGNDGADASGYTPGSVLGAYIIGACDEDGNRIASSNYGETVDYYVTADSTSEAAAKFTGYLSARGLEAMPADGLIYKPGEEAGSGEEIPGEEEPAGAVTDFFQETEDGTQQMTLQVIGEGSVTYQPSSAENPDVLKESVTLTLPRLTYVRLTFDSMAQVFVQDGNGTDLEPYTEQAAGSFRDITVTSGIDKTVLIVYDGEAAARLQEAYAEVVAADLPSSAAVGSKYTGSCSVTSVTQPNGAGTTVTSLTFRGSSGYLNGITVTGSCADHSAAAPFVGQACTYTITVTAVSGTQATVSIYVVPNEDATDGVTSNQYGLIGYQRMSATATLTVEQSLGGLKVSKVSRDTSITDGNSNYSLSGAKYGIYTSSSCSSSSLVMTLTTNKYGNASTGRNALAARTYWVKEISASAGYQLDTAAHKIAVAAGSLPSANVVTSKEPPMTGKITVRKSSANTGITAGNANYSLKGAVYGVWTDSSCSGAAYQTMTTNSSGVASVSGLPLGTYYVKEMTASPGYAVNASITACSLTASVTSCTVPSKETPKTGAGTLQKHSGNTGITNGNANYSLEGAVYGIWTDSSCTGEPYMTMTTDASGVAVAAGLPFGTYYAKEMTAPAGYELHDWVCGPAEITEASPNGWFNDWDAPGTDGGGIRITKTCEGEGTGDIPGLAGTEFTIRYFDNMEKDTSGEATRTWVIAVQETADGEFAAALEDAYLVQEESDELYRNADGKTLLPYGTYEIRETKAAPAYMLKGTLTDASGNVVATDGGPYVTVVDKDSGAVKLAGGNEYLGYNTPAESSIKIRKMNGKGSALSGVTYELRNSKGETVAQETTGENGEAVFSGLSPDTYTVTEIKTAEGYSLLAEPLTVEAPMRLSEEEAAQENVDRSKLIFDPSENIYYVFNLTYEVTDGYHLTLPMTGAVGIWFPGFLGFGIVLATTAVMWKKTGFRKRRKDRW